MGQVSIHLNGRTYRFECGDGDEARVRVLGEYIKGKIDQLGPDCGRAGDDRTLVMIALLLADEVLEARGVSDVPAQPAARNRKPGAA